MKLTQRKNGLLIIIFLLFAIISCEKKESKSKWTYQISKIKSSFIQTQRKHLISTKSSFESLKQKINFFYTVPAAYALDDCRNRWKSVYENFLLLGPYSHFPVSLDAGLISKANYFDISSIDYEFVDYSVANPTGGMINDVTTYPTIDYFSLLANHQLTDSKKITIGFHVLEFIFWGEDNTLLGPGTRPNTDFSSPSLNYNRRREFLTASSLHLEGKLNEINFGSAYESKLNQLDPQEFIMLYLTSIADFIEIDIKQTISIPMNSLDHKDELSDFSDETINHLKRRFKALELALDGSELFNDDINSTYFLIDFIEEISPNSASIILSKLQTIDIKINSLNLDFENAINDNPSRQKLLEIINLSDDIKNELITIRSSFE
jgi:putative iron-regulated protein